MRIITGKARGLKLKTPVGLSTRPTSDRVKESLFSILSGLIDFAAVDTVLDIFAGTGALGLEAVSRGARAATFIDTATTQIIRDNVTLTRFEGCTVLRGDFDKILRRLARQELTFDLIFSDAPYGKGLAQQSLNLVTELNLPSAGGLIVVEHGADEILIAPSTLRPIRNATYGNTTAIEIFVKEQTA